MLLRRPPLRGGLAVRCRLLHARHAKSICSIISPDHLHLSPIHGLLLYGSPALSSLWAAGEATGPPAARLARALFNRHEPEEPLVPARNKSLPAIYLTPELLGHCLGLGLRKASDAEVRSALYDLGVDAIARESKCSIARFERLVHLMGVASHSTEPMAYADGSVNICGTSVCLAFLWARARSKRCILAFLTALQPHMADSSLLAPEVAPECEEWQASFQEPFGEEVTYMLGGGSRSVAPSEEDMAALCEGGAVPHAALERLAFQLVARSGQSPEIPQQVYGYKGQPPIADCVEACAREAMGLALWDGKAYDTSRLPETADPKLLGYFESGGACDGMEAGQIWFDLVSAREGLSYMLGTRREDQYELFPSIDNFAATLSSLLRTDVPPPPEDGSQCPVWPRSRLLWQRAGTSRHPELLLRRPDASYQAGSSASQAPDEDLRIVFNGARHCYSTRDATAAEPAWVGRVRHAWRRRLPTAPSAAAAAARLLHLRGTVVMARHEALHREAEERLALVNA